MTDHYDVIVIGSGAGGGTLTYALAATGKRILLLERGGFMPREIENWDSRSVWLDKRYTNAGKWHDVDTVADLLQRPRALVHQGRAAVPGARPAGRRPHRAACPRALPVPGDQ